MPKTRELTQADLIADLKRVSTTLDGNVTRAYYRSHTKLKEAYLAFFPTFGAFVKAAGLNLAQVDSTDLKSVMTKDKWTLTLPNTHVSTEDELVSFCKIDLQAWELVQFDLIRKTAKESSFSVKAVLKKRTQMVAIREEIEQLKLAAKRTAKVPKLISRKPVKDQGLMLEISIPDAHWGKMCHSAVTGYENYDVQIAEHMFMRAFHSLLERTKGYQFESILWVCGNDILNADNVQGTTTKGTLVNTDGRYHKTFLKVREAMVTCVETLRQIAPTKVIMVSGNHDQLSVWHLGDSLECYFNNYKDVTIDNSPTYRKYHQHGKVMLMLTHGDKGKRSDYPLLMATEQPTMFGETMFRESHAGHLHQTRLEESHGVRVRILPSLSPPDDWHSSSGFTGNLRNAEAYVWSKTEGLVAVHTYNDQAQTPIRTKRIVL